MMKLKMENVERIDIIHLIRRASRYNEVMQGRMDYPAMMKAIFRLVYAEDIEEV